MKPLKRPDILQVIDDYGLEKKQIGNSIFTCCLWHKDSNPSLALYPETNSYYCFVCHVSGTVENLLAKLQHKTYYQVIQDIYGSGYEFRKLGETIKKVDPDTGYMQEMLSRELRSAIQSNKYNIDNVPQMITKIINTKMSMETFKELLEEIRNA